MMGQGTVAAFVGFGGILLGGGLSALQIEIARRREGRAIAAALREDVACLLAVADARHLVDGIQHYLAELAEAVVAGRGDQRTQAWRIPMSGDYFCCYTAMLPRLHLLVPRDAARFTRFYTFAKAATEVMTTRGAPYSSSITDVARMVRTELAMLKQTIEIGREIVVRDGSA